MADKQQSFDLEPKGSGPVECLGMTFESDEARRAYFLERLKEKLQDPKFRDIPGFPRGTNEDILRMSDPPYYTACPNPFVGEYVRNYGRPYDPHEEYHREPLAVDVRAGKSDALYKSHRYHTKVPFLAIAPAILHYTNPGDIVLDGFCGSGMTGVASQWCGVAPPEDRATIESSLTSRHGQVAWGLRHAILADLSPAATAMASVFNLATSPAPFVTKAEHILRDVEESFGWMFETTHSDGVIKGRINYVAWSEVFACPDCSAEIIFLRDAWDDTKQQAKDNFPCPHCGSVISKRKLDRIYENHFDQVINQVVVRPKRIPYWVNYTLGRKTHVKPVDEHDLEVIRRAEVVPLRPTVPVNPLPYMHMTHERARMDKAGITHSHHFYFHREALVIGALWEQAEAEEDASLRAMLLFWLDSNLLNLSIQNCYRPSVSFPYNPMTGIYYVSAAISEANPFVAYHNKLKRMASAFANSEARDRSTAIQTGDCTSLLLDQNSIDYVFTDPPFGENIYYSDLNYLIESWRGIFTNASTEAIIDKARKKTIFDYQTLMTNCFEEYFRVLKPGRWMTVVFSNSSNAVWRAIQEAIGRAGFVIADVRTLDKQQGSYRQVTSSAMKQDLVISAYKPTESTANEFNLKAGTQESAWAFVDAHLKNVPLFVAQGNEFEVTGERTPQTLLDRMIAFHVQRGVTVPLAAGEFFEGLDLRYAKRDGMYFLREQAIEYDKQRANVESVKQLSFDVTDEASAILWLRLELERKPQSFQELQPMFMRESQTWAGHEKTVELKEILEENFLQYDGSGPVPTQVHMYLSTNFKDMRGLAKDDPSLRAKAAGRWYVPDRSKQADVDQLRSKRLLKEFMEYKDSKKKLKQFRTEAMRAGFRAAYDRKDYRTIVNVAQKLPEHVLQEDEKLLMYYDVASMRLGED